MVIHLKGIGSHFAKKLVGAFGENVFNVIEETPEKLIELEGIGTKRKQQLVYTWDERKIIRNIMDNLIVKKDNLLIYSSVIEPH